MPSTSVLQDQRVQDVAAADTPQPSEAEGSATVQQIVKMVGNHQSLAPYALHGYLQPWVVRVIISQLTNASNSQASALRDCRRRRARGRNRCHGVRRRR